VAQSLRFTLPSRQERTPVVGTVVIGLVALLAGLTGSLEVAAGLGGVAVLVSVLYLLVMFRSYGEFDETGIRSQRGVFRNAVTWAEVRQVKLDPKSGQCLMVYRRQGKPFKVGAPVSGGLAKDPQYQAKIMQVLDFVAAHTR